MIVSDQQIALGRAMAQGQSFGEFGFLDLIGGAIASVVGGIIGGPPKTQPASPPQTINVNVPPPAPKSPLETAGGILAVLGGSAAVITLFYTLGKD